jgi:hypothetical protein
MRFGRPKAAAAESEDRRLRPLIIAVLALPMPKGVAARIGANVLAELTRFGVSLSPELFRAAKDLKEGLDER